MPALRYGNNTVSGTGVRFDMCATNIKFQFNNFIDVSPEPMKAISNDLNGRIADHKYNGEDSPRLTFDSYIDESIPNATCNAAGDPIITLEWMGSLARVVSGWLLYPAISRFLGLGNDPVPVVIDSVKTNPNVLYIKGGSEYIIPFNVSMIVVSGPV